MTTFIFNSDQIGIPLFNLPKDIKNKVIELVESKGFHQDYSTGGYYISVNFKLKLWFEHSSNAYYPDLPIKNTSNPFPEIKKFLLNEIDRNDAKKHYEIMDNLPDDENNTR